ncbi:hypothetical protein [Thioalkalivibrio sp. HK1]|uniref:hypothetical protein n=1 Tax=Thioalkalivibrio sp. HK1 TaxID=1469245 RepID=UPI0004B7DDB8|nr:hypothetical protein [Thioalkalivibrio sp. HK1]
MTVSIASNNSDITTSPSSLTFTTSNYSTAKTVTVSGAQDSDTENDGGRVTFSATGGIIAPNTTRDVTVVDDDVQLRITKLNDGSDTSVPELTSLTVAEGAQATFYVRLNARPSGTGTVTLTPSHQRISLDTTTLTFDRWGNTNNWSRGRLITVSASHDDDAQDNSYSINVTATGANIAGKSATISVPVTDDDEPRVNVNKTSLNLEEGGQPGTFNVRLDTRPSSNVTVNVTVSPSNSSLVVDTDSAASGNQTALTFNRYGTTKSWSTAQTVSLSAAHDDDIDDEFVTVTVLPAAGSGDYVGVYSLLQISIADDDDPVGTIDITPAGALQIDESDTTGQSMSVSLSVQPKSNVRVSLSKTNPDVVLSSSFLNFTRSNYSTAQSVIISATDDDDAADESDTVTFSATGRIIAPDVTKSVSIIDDEPPPGTIDITPSGAVSIDEEDASGANLSVKLSAKPKSNVTVSLSKSNPDITLSPTSLTFTPSNYSTAKQITVTANSDDDAGDEAGTITFSATGKFDAPNATRRINIQDDDEPALDLKNVNALSLDEGASGHFEVRPAFRPSGNITVTVTPSDPSISVVPSTLAFNQYGQTNAWNQHRRVTVTANHDDDANDGSFSLSIAGSGANYQGTSGTITVAVTDDDTPPGDIHLSGSGLLKVTEGESSDLSVWLRPDPNATAVKENITISLTNSLPNITLSPNSLTFTPSNYSTAQNFSILTRDDSDFEDDFDKITLEASGGIIASSVTRTLILIDSDRPPVGDIVVFDPQIPPLAEGDSVSVGVRLSKAPVGSATISLLSDRPDLTLSPSSLTFTSSDHSITQPVSIVANEDEDDTDDSALITIEISGGGFSASRIFTGVSIIDNDKSGPPPSVHNYDGTLIIAPEGDLEIDEGGEGAFQIRLSAKPIGEVPVRISKITDASGVGISRRDIAFTPSDWNEDQTIRVSAHKDSDTDDSIHTYLFSFEGKSLLKDVMVNDIDRESLKAQALALPPPDANDGITLRIRCRQSTPCMVSLDCAAQSDGSIYQGALPEPIPAYQARSYTAQDIQGFMGGKSWAGKGRLECSLRGNARIGAQVWTRSGNGVLVNNSALIRSVRMDGVYRADIESIPSPDSSDESNIRIRCNSDVGDCLDTSFVCYLDDGRRLTPWHLGQIERRMTRHLQSAEIASNIGYRWKDLGLGCEVSSKGRFTLQVLTRTGGGGALVNNSAGG